MSDNIKKDSEEFGTVKISDDVVSVISGLAATEIKGVAGMSGGIAGGIAELLGRKNQSKGVKVTIGENEVNIDLHVVMEYGVKIPDVAWEIQEKVKKAVETMTGLNVVEVNIHVQGVTMDKVKDEEDEEK
ncbi:MAG: Asp23/Gls24 family envelope stress response protein [Bacillota bacterium]|nr:Asp23/Gls24 family envelope stress response protein [Bacillota bacterium]MDD3298681.1 Asp23/Gls24 family envelope stress response protein [Bacillota bacterium]MDD3850528.1 Asp23/Gls24 family envelope stress response protein [Bacillota bacterium]MDD4707658.1 Asp23/Gls24 family envelope stress response protein [Bacillota bacterium]